MSTLDDTNDLIIDRKGPFGEDSVEIHMTIARILVCCSLCIGTPLNFIPMRKMIFDILFSEPKAKKVKKAQINESNTEEINEEDKKEDKKEDEKEKEDPNNTTFRFNVNIMNRLLVASILFTSTSCAFTILLPGISVVLGIVGGIGAVTLAYIIPTMSYLHFYPEKKKTCMFYIFFASILIGIGVGAAINSLYRLLGNY